MQNPATTPDVESACPTEEGNPVSLTLKKYELELVSA
jgi:hypothetical protein